MGLEISTFSNPSAFLGCAQEFLARHELENSLMLGLVMRLEKNPRYFQSTPCLKIVHHQGQPVVYAVMTPPHNIILAGDFPSPGLAFNYLVQDLRSEGWSVPGVLAKSSLAEQFSEVWKALVPYQNVTLHMQQRLYALQRVHPQLPTSGFLRQAETHDQVTLIGWIRAFQIEALGDSLSHLEAEAIAVRRIAEGECFLWEDNQPVSMAAWSRPTWHTISIGLVYTPPEQRRKGYASALVAALSQKLLDEGFEYITLFTNLAFPTSNHIYQQIGYRPVCDFAEYRFL